MKPVTPPRTLVNASSYKPYKPQVLQPARSGADDHKKVQSLGLLSGKTSGAA